MKQTEKSCTIELQADWSNVYLLFDWVEFIQDRSIYIGRIVKELPRNKYLIALPWGRVVKVKHKNIVRKMDLDGTK